MNKKLIQNIKNIIIKELNLPNDDEKERLRIELYKTLEGSMSSMKLTDRSIVIDLSPIQEVLKRYGYSALHTDIEIPLVRSMEGFTYGRQ